MKLIRLEILNLASLDRPEGEVIDFEQGSLGSSNIFSIVGPTGSGKSTLLDAICLALYGRTPRYPRKSGEQGRITVYGTAEPGETNRLAPTDSRNILTRGKKDGYSKLIFQTNDGCIYRAEWHAHFRRLVYANPEKLLFRLTKGSDGVVTEHDEDWNSLPQLIGLEFEQFLNTVLIAQGAFADFINAPEKDRFALLEKLVGCEDLYTHIVDQIVAHNAEANRAYTEVSATVETIKQDLLTDEQLDKLDHEIDQLNQAEQELSAQLKDVDDQLRWHDLEERLANDVATSRANADKAQDALAAYADTTSRLTLHDALTPAIDILRQVKRLEQESGVLLGTIKSSEHKVAKQTEVIQTESEKLESLNHVAQTSRQAIEDAAPHILKARELITQIDNAQTTLTDRQKTKLNAEQERNAAQKALEQNMADIAKAEQAAAEAKALLNDTQTRLQREHEELAIGVQTAQSQLKAEQAKIEGIDVEQLQRDKSVADSAVNDLSRAIDIVSRLNQATDEHKAKAERQSSLEQDNAAARSLLARLDIAQLNQEVDTLNKSFTLMTSERWELHRHTLTDGEACPLCGATQHPYVADTALYDEAKTSLHTLLATKRAELQRQNEVSQQQTAIIARNEGEMSLIAGRLQQLGRDISHLDTEWNSLQRHHNWPKNLAGLEGLKPDLQHTQEVAVTALSAYNRTQQKITQLVKKKDSEEQALNNFATIEKQQLAQAERKVSECDTQLASLKAVTPTLSQHLADKQQALDSATGAWQLATEALNRFKAQYEQELGGKHPDTVEQHLAKVKDDAEAAIVGQNTLITKLKNDLSALLGALENQRKQLAQKQQELTRTQQQLTQWMTDYNAHENRLKEVTQADVEVLLCATDDWENIRMTGNRLAQDLASKRAVLNVALNTHAEHQHTKPELNREQLQVRLAELKQSSRQEQLINAKTLRKKHDDARASLGEKDAALQQAKQAVDDWKGIYNIIGNTKGDTLRKIAQCYTLGFLVEHANAEIAKFNSRYRLQQVKNSLGIRVIDHDRADDVRDVTTLSGGETFIVSLGLALGLSSLSSRNIRFDNLFIDEGFGTLDADTLATVIDSLAMLQTSQGKKVGVISHTDTMSERITTQIRVIPNGSTGSSRIEIVP